MDVKWTAFQFGEWKKTNTTKLRKMGAGKAFCGFPKLQQRLSRTHGGSRHGKSASQSFTISKMKLLKTKHWSENTKNKWCRQCKIVQLWFLPKFRSNYADNIISNQLTYDFFFSLTPTLIYDLLWPKLNAAVLALKMSSIDQLWLISERVLLYEHSIMIKHSARFGFLFQKSFLGLNAKKKKNLCREKCLSSGINVWWMSL